MKALIIGGCLLLIPIAAYGLFLLMEDGPGGRDADGFDILVGIPLYLFGLPMIALGLALTAAGLCTLAWRRVLRKRIG